MEQRGYSFRSVKSELQREGTPEMYYLDETTIGGQGFGHFNERGHRRVSEYLARELQNIIS